ncbi:MAG: mechanosensitive ion channel family protein [Deltaproteobacteria bacterium]|nr:mechanosensitive ion channel family protein [Deltaproteobacteria bacterium]
MQNEIASKVERLGHVLTEYGADMVQAMVVLVVGLLLLQFVMRKLKAFVDKKAKDRVRATTIFGIVYILSLVFILSAALITIGFDSRNIFRLIVLVALGVIVVLLVLRPYLPTLPFKVGNTVKVGALLGKIEATTMVHTRMRTFDGKTVFIPNSKIFNDFVINYHFTPTRRLKIDIPIRHARDILRTKQLMEAIMIEDPRALLKPARPVVYVLNLVDGCVKIGARCWVENAKFWVTQCDLLEKFLAAMDREKITLAGRRQAIRVFHETPLQLIDADPETAPGEPTGPNAVEASFSAVSDADEI